MQITRIIYVVILLVSLCSCIQETHLKTIHFKVDMTGIENASDVGVRGEFGSDPWNETIYFNDKNGDGIYEGTVTKKTGQGGIRFKFVNHHDQFELSGQENRVIRFEYKPETISYKASFNDPNAKTEVVD